MKTIQICLSFFIVYTILQELLPAGSFRKYMRFMGGLIFLLLFFQNLFQMEKEIPVLYRNYYRHAKQDFTDAYEDNNLQKEYLEQMEEQMQSFLESEGYEIRRVKLRMEDLEITSVEIWMEHADSYDELQLKNRVGEVYSIETTHIHITRRDCTISF